MIVGFDQQLAQPGLAIHQRKLPQIAAVELQQIEAPGAQIGAFYDRFEVRLPVAIAHNSCSGLFTISPGIGSLKTLASATDYCRAHFRVGALPRDRGSRREIVACAW